MTEEKVVNMWDEMAEEKENLGDELEVELNDKSFNIEIKFIDLDIIQEINDEFQEKMPPKPVVKIQGKELKVPIEDDEKLKSFNSHPKAQEAINEWNKEKKPIEKERIYRLAYEFIEDDMKPSEDVDEGVEKLMKALRYGDAIKIVNKGMGLLNFQEQMDEARKN